MTEQHSQSSTSRRETSVTCVLVALLVLTPLVAIIGFSAPVAAQDNESMPADYYEGETDNVDNETWMDGNEDATAENMTTMLSRVSTFVVGSDESGDASGAMLTGMLLFGGILGVFVTAGVGMVAGAVLTLFALFGVIAVGLAPAWLYPVGLFGIGVLLSASAKRTLG